MFSKLHTYAKYSKEVITIQQLQNLVKNNPQKDKIEYLRTLVYKSPEYKKVKSQLSCIMPHGIFDYTSAESINKLSNYLFFDIDGIEENELDDLINRLTNKFPISYLHRSVSNRGIHFLINVPFLIPNVLLNNVPFTTANVLFNNIHNYVISLLEDEGFIIDKSAKGLSRKMIISSDQNNYINENAVLDIDTSLFNNFLSKQSTSVKLIKGQSTTSNITIGANVPSKQSTSVKLIKAQSTTSNITIGANVPSKQSTSVKLIKGQSTTSNITIGANVPYEIIPIADLYREISIETKYTKDIDDDFVIEDMEYYFIKIPQFIKDGTKHTLYTRIINALYFINENKLTRQHIFSFLFYVNSTANPPMNLHRLKTFMDYICDNIEQNGVKLKPRIKRIHFNKESNITKKEKQVMGARITAIIKNNKTLQLIDDARMECAKMNVMPTKTKIAEITGLSYKTIQRNWDKEMKSINDIELERFQPEPEKKEYLFEEEISEDNFLNEPSIIKEKIVQPEECKREITYNYKGFKEVTITITKEDILDFKIMIDKIKQLDFDISIGTLEKFNYFGYNKYKMDYMMNKKLLLNYNE